MNGMKKTLTLAAAFALLFGAGCCDGSPRRAAAVSGVRGVVANSTSVTLVASSSGRGWAARGCVPCIPCDPCGGPAAPRSDAGCPPPPPLPAAAPESAVPGAGCPVSPFDGVVCAPADNLGECFTLPEREVRPEVEIYVPNGGVLEKLSDIPPRDDPYQAAVNRSAGEAAAEPAPAPAAPDAAADAGTDDADPGTVAEETAPAEPAEPEEGADLSAALPSPAADAEMPPVFRDGMTDGADEEVLSRAGQPAAAGGLPRVELPPELE